MALPTKMAFKECSVAILCIFNNFVLSHNDLCKTQERCCVEEIWQVGFQGLSLTIYPEKEVLIASNVTVY